MAYRYKALRDCTVRISPRKSLMVSKGDIVPSSTPLSCTHLKLVDGPQEPVEGPEPEQIIEHSFREEGISDVVFDAVEWNAIISALPNKPTIVEFGTRIGVEGLKVKTDRQETIDTIIRFMREMPLDEVQAARKLLL